MTEIEDRPVPEIAAQPDDAIDRGPFVGQLKATRAVDHPGAAQHRTADQERRTFPPNAPEGDPSGQQQQR